MQKLSLVSILVLGWFLFLAVDVQFLSTELFLSTIPRLASFIVLVLLVVNLVSNLVRRKFSKRTGFFAILFLLLALEFAVADAIIKRQVEASEIRGNRIVTALKEYKLKKNTYPDSLEELIPEFIESIPLAERGISKIRFKYSKVEKSQWQEEEGYQLYFPGYRRGFNRFYMTTHGEWIDID